MTTPSSPIVTFWGAARTVTGSMHLVEWGRHRLLLDCGMFQGHRSEARERNSRFPFATKDIDAVVLSHAHIDHCGNLPNLVRQGFSGPIHCTPATADLAEVMLTDSARIQEEDAEYLNRKQHRGGRRIEPLYDVGDVQRTARLLRTTSYNLKREILPGIQLSFVDAGHLLGSAMVSLTFQTTGGERSLTFTGDLGRRGLPILRDPAPVPPGELLICESTYGGRTHPPVDELTDELAELVARTHQRGGKLLIPAFSLGRTQAVVYFLHLLIQANRLPDLPIYVDSPLAANATEIFQLHPECFDAETTQLLKDRPELFGGRHVRYLRTPMDSKRVNARQEPCIVIAASGMCETGRILHHLKQNVEDPRATIAIIGYQAPNTLGRRLLERQPQVRIHDQWLPLQAEVVALNGFSSHADHNDFLSFLGPLSGSTKKVRLVHGEEAPAEALAQALRALGFADVGIPERGEQVSW
ncbi:MAG: MBL fold metallo-hydrolase [Planctomycetia bacterium]|nr:MBL fold metallo-hydrolase [Planctomycetia bacterium]